VLNFQSLYEFEHLLYLIQYISPMIRTSIKKWEISRVRESDKSKNLAKLRHFKLEKVHTFESKRDTF